MLKIDDLQRLMADPEGERLEFKEAKSSFEFDKLAKYCSALANEGGGKIVLGVSDKRPRKIVGSQAFDQIEKTRTALIQKLHVRVDCSEVQTPSGRVLIFEVPSRPVGNAVPFEGSFWMREGESLVPMKPEALKKIHSEGVPDFSSEIAKGATFADLDGEAISLFISRWYKKIGRDINTSVIPSQVLEDAELLVDGQVTNAALLLLGSQKALSKFIPQAEIIFEYRLEEGSIPYQDRKEFRAGFLLINEAVWETFKLRNTVHFLSEGLFKREVRAFNEDATREGILNSFCHRDYRLEGSIFIKQYPFKTEIISPGGFPPEINPANILFRQSPRNRRLAEACAKCGLVERSGQGVDRMFSASVLEGKLPPDYSMSDSYHVDLTLHGQVQDPSFLVFLEKVSEENQQAFRTEDLVVLDAIHRGLVIPQPVQNRVQALIDLGVIERVARKKLILSHKFYSFVGKAAEYTRKRGLDRSRQKALILQHLDKFQKKGCPLNEIAELFPELSKVQSQVLLRTMKTEGEIRVEGLNKGARWFPKKK